MELTDRLARFAPVTLTADRAHLDERQQVLVRQLIESGRYMHEIYLRQIWPGNAQLHARLATSDDPEDRPRLRLFELMGGAWDRFADNDPFIGEQARPPGGGFYPEDLTEEEFDAWLEAHPEDRPAFTGYFTVIRRRGEDLEAVPYHQAYREWLEPAAETLQAAAALADHPPLAEYLRLRAQALLDDDYFDSDCAWVALQNGPIEIVLGPYEVYEDQLFGYKAAYEAVVGLRDLEESARLQELVGYLPALAAHLPAPEEYRGKVAGLASPIVVADTVYNGGLKRTVAIPIAFVLPNDPRARTTVGTKKVMVKNVCQAKFERILRPIAQRLLDPEQAGALSFEEDFGLILLHEISHALGVRQILQPDGTYQPLHHALRDLFGTIEECKADIVGLYNILFLADERAFPQEWKEISPASYLAHIFRLTRWGTSGAHARANLLAFNFLREAGAIRRDRESGRFRAEPRSTARAVKDLAEILLRIEGRGDYEGAQALVKRYVRVSRELEEAWEQVADVPVDLAPTYPWADDAAA